MKTINIKDEKVLRQKIIEIVEKTPLIDIHTHLFSTNFHNLFLWGIDELLVYHYLVAEYFTYETEISPVQFYQFDKKKQAELVWNKLFIENTPISEATRGVVTVLHSLGIDIKDKDLEKIRQYFSKVNLEEYIDKVFKLANIDYLIMTNNPFNQEEREVWLSKGNNDERFKTALRIDPLLFDFPHAMAVMKKEGFEVDENLEEATVSNIRKFFDKWIKIINPLYIMCSVMPEFIYPIKDSFTTKIIDKILIPVMKDHSLPFALMFGVKKLVNPKLGLAGDAVSKSDINTVINFASLHPDCKFLMTFLSRENIHEAAVAARKFGNIRVFGCWWFTNIPVIVEEIVRMRMELLGTNFIPQHSDARVLEQIIYKWRHFKKILAKILIEKYADIMNKGWQVSDQDIQKDIKALYQDRFTQFIQ